MLLQRVVLQHFFGFPETYSAELGRFTTLVGPNNGGKTTILRAIQFATDTFRVYFGDRHEPNLDMMGANWQSKLSVVGPRLGIPDSEQFYYGRSRRREPKVRLTFQDEQGEVSLETTCLSGSNLIKIEVFLNNNQLQSKERNLNEGIIARLYCVRARFVPPLGTLTPTEKEIAYPKLLQ